MERLLLLLCLLASVALGACRLGTDPHQADGDEPAARPEVRYYMIADT